jgi:hypothetical protein
VAESWLSPAFALSDLLAALPPKQWPTPLRLVVAPSLAVRPRLERERFSGGFNVSAMERNQARREEARTQEMRCYVDNSTGAVYASPNAAIEVRRMAKEAGVELPEGAPPLVFKFGAVPVLTADELESGHDFSLLRYRMAAAMRAIERGVDRSIFCRLEAV